VDYLEAPHIEAYQAEFLLSQGISGFSPEKFANLQICH
jgi:hypothetical protein